MAPRHRNSRMSRSEREARDRRQRETRERADRANREEFAQQMRDWQAQVDREQEDPWQASIIRRLNAWFASSDWGGVALRLPRPQPGFFGDYFFLQNYRWERHEVDKFQEDGTLPINRLTEIKYEERILVIVVVDARNGPPEFDYDAMVNFLTRDGRRGSRQSHLFLMILRDESIRMIWEHDFHFRPTKGVIEPTRAYWRRSHRVWGVIMPA